MADSYDKEENEKSAPGKFMGAKGGKKDGKKGGKRKGGRHGSRSSKK